MNTRKMNHFSASSIAFPPEGSPTPRLRSKHFAQPPVVRHHVLESLNNGDDKVELGPAVHQPSKLLRKDWLPTILSRSDGSDYYSPIGPPPMISRSLNKARILLYDEYYGPTNAPYSSPTPTLESPPPPPPPPPPPYQSSEYGGPASAPYSSPPPPPLGSTEFGGQVVASSRHSSSSSIGLAVGVTVGVVILVLAALIAAYFFWYKKRQTGTTNKELDASTPPKQGADTSDKLTDNSQATASSQSKIVESSGSTNLNVSSSSTFPPGTPKARSTDPFTFEEIIEATNNFSKENLLGKGGFGHVYKGFLNGKPVAIKQLKPGSHQGEREFAAEIEIISHIHHRNLVSLVGFSIQGSQRLLVYEFVANNSLAYHLHAPGAETLAWKTRMQIAIGSAKGLAYLHEDCEPKIIHRDIKATNILLDSNFKAKVSDFGLAKFVSECETHITTRVMGTLGYLAPEYASSGKLTEKSDVYSFGIVLLEIISGREAIDLIDWARPVLAIAIEHGIYDELVDPKLEKQYNKIDMKRMVACAAACIHPYAQDRPQMIEIARVLEGVMSTDDLKVKPKDYSLDVFYLLKHDPRVAAR